MKRADFMKIIKLRSFWKIDRRKGDYRLPNGERLSSYIEELISGQMELDSIAIASDGNLYHAFSVVSMEHGFDKEYTLLLPGENERCNADKMDMRIKRMALDMLN